VLVTDPAWSSRWNLNMSSGEDHHVQHTTSRIALYLGLRPIWSMLWLYGCWEVHGRSWWARVVRYPRIEREGSSGTNPKLSANFPSYTFQLASKSHTIPTKAISFQNINWRCALPFLILHLNELLGSHLALCSCRSNFLGFRPPTSSG
jgi:hypothetical protein